MLPAQRTGFNTLDNWGHKIPTQSKRKRTGKKGLKGHGLEHVYNTRGYIYLRKDFEFVFYLLLTAVFKNLNTYKFLTWTYF